MPIAGYHRVGNTPSVPPVVIVPPKGPDSGQKPEAVVKKESSTVPAHSPIRSFKLKEAMSQTETPDVVRTSHEGVPQKHTINAREAFQAGDVTVALANFPLPDGSVVLKTGLMAHPPLIEGERIVLEVDNEWLQGRLEELKTALHRHLMTSLNNGGISLHISLFDESKGKKEEKRLFTAGDKFDYFVKINPVVEKLKGILGLEIE